MYKKVSVFCIACVVAVCCGLSWAEDVIEEMQPLKTEEVVEISLVIEPSEIETAEEVEEVISEIDSVDDSGILSQLQEEKSLDEQAAKIAAAVAIGMSDEAQLQDAIVEKITDELDAVDNKDIVVADTNVVEIDEQVVEVVGVRKIESDDTTASNWQTGFRKLLNMGKR